MRTASSSRPFWIPLLVFLVLAGGLFVTWRRFQEHEDELLYLRTQTTTEQVALRLEGFIGTRLDLIRQMRREWLQNHINSPDRFRQIALAIQSQFGGFQAINWVDADGVIRWIVPEASNRPAKDRDPKAHAGLAEILESATRTNQPLASHPLDLFQGGRGLGTYFPLLRDGVSEGYLNGVFRIAPLVEDCLRKGAMREFHLRITDGGEELYMQGPPAVFRTSLFLVQREMVVLDRRWTVALVPTPSLAASYRTPIDEVFVILGLILAVGLAWTLRVNLQRQVALRASERQLRLVVDHMPIMVIAFDADRRIVAWNRHCKQITGYGAEEVVGNPEALSLLCPDPVHRQELAHFWFGSVGSENEVECTVHCKDGSVRTLVWVNASDRFAVPGWAFWGVGIDVTQRRKAEDALRMTQFSIDHAAVVAFWIDRDARFCYANEAACKSLGYTREELLSLKVFDVDPGFPRDQWEAHLQEVKQRGFNVLETVCRMKDGREFPAEITANHIEYRGKEYHCTFARDLTERKRAEEERLEIERQLLETQKLESLGLLAGGIAHDFNNLLTTMLGSVSLARKNLAPQAPTAEHLRHIEAAAQQAADLARQLLAYSGKGRFVIRVLDLDFLVEEMCDLLRVSTPPGVQLDYKRHEEPLYIEADASQIRQVMMNLVMNAAEAIGDSTGTVTIRTDLTHVDQAYLTDTFSEADLPEGRYVVLEVSDTGCGMDAETQSRIFEPFFSTKATGRGLGLAAVLGIVRGHRGAMKVYSEPGKGTMFKVLLPFSGRPAESPVQPSPTSQRDPGTGGVVLIVDDESSVRHIAEAILEEGGYTVLAAEDGVEGVALFRAHADDVRAVLLDMIMPRMDGEQVFREIRHIREDVPILLTSGYNEQEATNHFSHTGFSAFIQKPYRADQLLQTIHRVIQADSS